MRSVDPAIILDGPREHQISVEAPSGIVECSLVSHGPVDDALFLYHDPSVAVSSNSRDPECHVSGNMCRWLGIRSREGATVSSYGQWHRPLTLMHWS